MKDITLESLIYPKEKIVDKSISEIDFKDVISLVFYGTIFAATEMNEIEWKKILDEFNLQLEKQNKCGWPTMSINRNDFDKRMEIFVSNTSFVTTNNFLTLLFRLLLIENYKRPYIFKSYNYHKILGHKNVPKKELFIGNNTLVKNLTLHDIFNLLDDFINYYLKIFGDDTTFEYRLAKRISLNLNS